MTQTVHEFDQYTDVRAALADPALVPPPPAEDGPAGASVAWLRASVARFSSGEAHRRRRSLVEAELARLDPAALRNPAPDDGDLRVRVVRTLAEALGLPEPAAVAAAVPVVAGAYFGHQDPAADAAVAELVALLGPDPKDEAAMEAAAGRIGLLVQACDATAALVEAAAGGDAPPARVLRDEPPVRTTRRVATAATRIGGRPIAEGDAVLLRLAADRDNPVPLVFGAPPRVCPGRAHALALADGLLGRALTPFARLHHQATPLLLPNAWDHASAAALAAQGFPAVGTTSLGVAAAAGLPDGAAATAAATLELARVLGRGPLLFTVDAEGGFSDEPAEVAELARRLHEAGAAGINLEDGRADGTLAPARLHAAKITAVKAAVPELFVNARTDTHWLGLRQEETAARLAVYEQAGADGVFVPGLSDPEGIAELTASLLVPLNILYSPAGPGLAELAELGVRRVSLGSLLYRTALAAAVDTATAVRDGRPVGLAAPSYAQVQEFQAPGASG
ncbi:isocitrate lyase/phosphoenolpyruvate mutase family protein [Allonocardiopsis opalescens]|uniref:2-methylisocitrate lyase-like PEP mutase family enzyme n=1 Tax=Allonocardiopsis opalescens TaxID=1144618 RepID=A0A2T0Q5F1_9ACTN|nr:isocitrate lyase/phosphoenolpyruvate mutase family protein [Allonocardiopsis opalescens]PRX99026.1 2-methylisocitrate lyase-like PEP mutase family enzyme [Allonocardiopsis opalescens]